MERLTGTFVVKAVKRKAREIEGYFTTIHEDREGESFDPEWFRDTISKGGNYYNNPIVLYNHDNDRVIGKVDVDSLKIDKVGVRCIAQISDDDVWAQIDRGELNAFSWMGFADYENKAIDLVEISVVTTPVNGKAIFAIKKKALDLGLATEEDFKMEPKWKSVHLGSYVEASMATAAMERATYVMLYKASGLFEDTQTPKDERIAELKAMFKEYGELCTKLAKAIMPDVEQAVAVSKSFQGMLPEGFTYQDPITEDADTKSDGQKGDEDMGLSKEDLEALGGVIGTAVGTAVSKGLEPLQQKLDALTPAAPPSTPPPATAPAAAPPAAQTPESSGDAAAVSKGLALDDDSLNKLGAAIAAGVVAAVKPTAKGLDPEPERDDQGAPEAKVKALIGRVKETKYHGPNVEQAWKGHTLDAVSLELTGKNFDDVDDGE